MMPRITESGNVEGEALAQQLEREIRPLIETPFYDERQSELAVPAAELGWDGATTAAEREVERA